MFVAKSVEDRVLIAIGSTMVILTSVTLLVGLASVGGGIQAVLSMQLASAVAFGSVGVGLIALGCSQSRIAAVSVVAPLVIVLTTFSKAYSNVPGWTAFDTSVGLALVIATVILATRRSRRWTMMSGALLATLFGSIGMLALLGYLSRYEELLMWRIHVGMSPLSAAYLIGTGIALTFWFAAKESRRLGVVPKWIAVPVFAAFTAGAIGLFSVLKDDQVSSFVGPLRVRSYVAEEMLVVGLLVAALAALATHLMRATVIKWHQAEAVARRLREEVARRTLAEREMADLYNNAPCGYHSLNADRLIVRMNDTELRWLGYSREEVVGKMTFDEMTTAEGRGLVDEKFQTFIRDGYVYNLEIDLIRKDGSILPVLLSSTAVYDHQGGFLRSRSMIFDMTERKKAEAALQTIQQRLELAIDGANLGLWTWNLSTNAVWFSPIFKAQLGCSDDDMASTFEAFESRIHPDDHQAAMQSLRGFAASPSPNFEIEYRLRHQRGSYRSILVRARIGIGKSGRSDELIGVHIDITHRKQAEAKYRDLLEAAPDAMIIVDRNGHIMLMNAQTERLFGYKRNELLCQSIEMLIPERSRDKQVLDRVAYGHNPHLRPMGVSRELYGVTKSGTEIPIEVSLSPSGSGPDMVVTAAIRDITQRREVDKLLREARDIADVANQAKSAFLAHMSHEIRTPIGIILGYVDALDNAATDEERSTYVDRLRKNAENLLELINDILDLSKVESGKIDIEHRRFKLVPFVSETVGSLRSRANAKATELSITWRDGVPETIDTDETRLRQVLINVLANAIKFTDQGSVSIDVALVPQANDRGERSMLQFLVKDTGCGIATASHKRIFDPFVQAESYTTRKHGGTGLGLSLSQRLAEALGGDVHLVRSELGAGSTFAVTIDPGDLAATTLINVVGEFRPAKRINGRSASSSSALSGMRVLLVEDAPDNQLIVKMFLTLRGASVDIANDGREGVAKAIQGDYHLVLMDIQMPNLNGYDATAALRRQGYARPIVALTAHAMKGERERCLEVGFDDYLTKPIERDELTALVSKFKPRSVAPGEAEATH